MPKNALGKVQGIDDDVLLRLILKPEDRSRLGLEGQIWQPRGALTGGRRRRDELETQSQAELADSRVTAPVPVQLS